MANQVKLTAIRHDAVQLSVDIPDLQEYMNALTVIFNNVRDRHELYRVSNNSRSTIFVDCKPREEEYVRDWLSQFGEVKRVGLTSVYTVELPDYDFDKYEEAFVVAEDD